MDSNVPAGKRILISGYYGFSNAGDEAVLSAIVSGLQTISSNSVGIAALSSSPEDTASAYGISAVSRMSFGEVSKAIDACDLLISGGGSLLQDVTSMKSLLYYLSIIGIAVRRHKKVMILGQGIGPLNRRISRLLVSKILNKIDLITVRDPQSADLLKQIGVRKPEMIVTADPTLLIEPAAKPVVDTLFEEAGIDPNGRVIAISLREWKAVSGLEDALISAIREISAEIQSQFLFITMHTPNDIKLAEAVNGAVSCGVIQPRKWTSEELVGVLGRCDMVIGMRLHALILATTAGVPSIGVAYDPKVEQFCASAGQPSVSLEDVIEGRLAPKAIGMWGNLSEWKARLANEIPSMREAALLNITKTLDLLRRD